MSASTGRLVSIRIWLHTDSWCHWTELQPLTLQALRDKAHHLLPINPWQLRLFMPCKVRSRTFLIPFCWSFWGNQAIALCTSSSVAILCGCTADMCLLVDDKAPSIACCCSEACQWGEAQVGRSITCITSLGESTGSAIGQDAEQAHHLQCL